MDSRGALTVNTPTEIRFVVQGADGSAYTPVGISFHEDASGARSDPLGHTAFPMRTLVAYGNSMQLSVFDSNNAPDVFEYSLTFQRPDGALGIIDPPVRNSGGNM